MRKHHRRSRPHRLVRRQLAVIEPRFAIEIDPIDVMLDLDPGMLDHSWLRRLPE